MTPTNGKKPLIRPEPIRKDGHKKKYDDDFWIYEEAIRNLKKDIKIVKAFKAYLEKEDYENMARNLEEFLNNEIKEKSERLDTVIERFEKVKKILE